MKLKPLLFLLLASGLSACVKKSDGPTPDNSLKEILFGKDTVTMYTGQKVSVDIQLSPSNYDKSTLIWNSSDTSLISVTNAGLISAKNEGTAKITVSNQKNTVKVSCIVAVKDSLNVGLISYYPFNNNANDLSGNNNNGVANNIEAVADRNGKPNSAYHFDGSQSFVMVEDKQALRLNNTDFTLSAWVKMDRYDYSYGSIILSKRISGYNNGWNWGVHGSVDSDAGKVTYGPGGGSTNAYSLNAVSLNSWHMITSVYTYATGEFNTYIDGILDNTSYNIATANPLVGSALYIGMDNPAIGAGYYFSGSLDEIRIYNRKLKTSDIQKLYKSSK